ncbi:MAG: tRNA (adenosine(37)-N6)-dimethylallyltransferase MiaA [Desulfobulbaceae bacterium]|nr:tRNA (adenosine(37)-N6)-dimethylallyltransferase MiaA [Desulfobulbaceae bacterium]
MNSTLSAVNNQTINTPVLVLLGPTAVGKTALSLALAELFACEVVSVDSMQVYRFMDIGTAKPTHRERERVVHHLIDIVDPDEQYNAAFFVRDALAAAAAISAAGRIPLFTGGTGLYLKALTEGLFTVEDAGEDESIRTYLAERLKKEGREMLFAELRAIDPESAARIHINDTQRLLRALEIYKMTGKSWSERLHSQQGPAVRFAEMLQIGLTCGRQTLYDRIDMRTHAMFAGGLIEEAEKLQKMGYSPELPSMQAIGYRHANNFLAGIWDREETIRQLARDTRRYAKRQMTWFSRNKTIEWYARDDHQGIIRRVETWLATA